MYNAIWKENLVVNQMSLMGFFYTPLHLGSRTQHKQLKATSLHVTGVIKQCKKDKSYFLRYMKCDIYGRETR